MVDNRSFENCYLNAVQPAPPLATVPILESFENCYLNAAQPAPCLASVPILEIAFENNMWCSLPQQLSWNLFEMMSNGEEGTYIWEHRSYKIDFDTMVQRNVANDRRRSVRFIWLTPEETNPQWTGQIP